MLALGLGAFLLVGVLVACACCIGGGDPPWLAGAADGETEAPTLPPRLDGTKSSRGPIGGPVFLVPRDLHRRFDARKSEHRDVPPAA